jgi:glycerophosphoryl diester phosphodiesterase
VIVFHDDSLGRTTGFAGLVSETSWEKIRTLDAGARFDPRFAGERVPLLEDALAATSLLVNVELKCGRADDRGLTAAVLRAVRRTASASRVLLSSFNLFCLLRARAREPSLPRALLFERDAPFAMRRGLSAPALRLAALHPEDELATDRAVARWRRHGYAVAPWTVDDPVRALALHRAGATGIITNVPDRLLEAFASRAPSPRA